MEEKIYRIRSDKLAELKKIINDTFTIPVEELKLEILYTPLIYLVPVYKYTSEINMFVRSVFGAKALEFKQVETIDFDYLSMFRPVRPLKRRLKFYIYLGPSDGKLRIHRIKAERIYDSFDYEVMFNHTGRFMSHEWVKAVQRVQGDNYLYYDKKDSSYVYYAMQHIEKDMLFVATFLYSLYMGEYEAEDLPIEWVKFLRGFGDNFDEVLENLNFVTALMVL
jgi:hypothetical protein